MGWNEWRRMRCSTSRNRMENEQRLHGGSAAGTSWRRVLMIIKRVSGERAFGTYFRVTPIRAPCSQPIVQLLNLSHQDDLFGPLCLR